MIKYYYYCNSNNNTRTNVINNEHLKFAAIKCTTGIGSFQRFGIVF